MTSEDNTRPLPKNVYGLSFVSKQQRKPTTQIRPLTAAFNLDEEDDNDGNTTKQQQKPGEQKTQQNRMKLNHNVQMQIEKALEEDPNIYEYDTVYDEISSTAINESKRRQQLEERKTKERKPLYVAGIQEAAKEREKQHEYRLERKIQREREKEGDLYKDKETFITTAYRLKLAERQRDLEKEKFEEQRESLLDVQKQCNFDAFCRYQFKVQTGEIVELEESEKIKTESKSDADVISNNESTKLTLVEKARIARQLRTQKLDDDENEYVDDKSETNKTITSTDEMYSRAKEKHAKAIEREHRTNNDDEMIINDADLVHQPPTTTKLKPKKRPLGYVSDDDDLDIGEGPETTKSHNRKQMNDKENLKKTNVDGDKLLSGLPIAAEKRRIANETRLEKVKRLCEKRTIGETFLVEQQRYFEREQQRARFKDYIERGDG
ncbi:unnamed protein product [Didymodactylos carnosus]|uniref:Nuclear speckle splicing regulatory protein 1 N-terminal domain-containing protein n=1 Tax=Didymodactylos carnosus TaxID=1234261 RepID=A0A813R594_9BILA|nr:unnamed protein product [Didymodactylos carnosus]CAF1173884.1 unnamed protein product [Didymodactylos carnosus]CAF3558726.1 unnamed protein product [Didymodactylos carnosus]CAF3985116.1 unnamed protein product [Didymodactylos carnosus]